VKEGVILTVEGEQRRRGKANEVASEQFEQKREKKAEKKKEKE